MDTKELKQKVCKEYGVQPNAVCIYQNERGTFVQMYNAKTNPEFAVSEKDIDQINKLIDGGERVFNAFSTHFQNNSKILELATNYILRGGNMMSLEGIVDFVNKSFAKKNSKAKSVDFEDYSILKPCGRIEGYKVEDMSLIGPVFCASILAEKMGGKNTQTRCFVEEIQTDSQDELEFASFMLSTFLPSLCANSDVNSIVVQSGALDGENQRQTRQSLEKFYKNCGFCEVQANDEFNCLKQSDFNQGCSVFVKQVDCERYFA